jgi:cytochrome c
MRRLPLFALSFALASGGAASVHADSSAGKSLFNMQCAMCHSVGKGAVSTVGPNLFGVVGRKAGSLAGFSYSPAMKAVDYAWTTDKIAAYLKAPATVIPGNRMPFAGLKGGQKAEDVADYLATLK